MSRPRRRVPGAFAGRGLAAVLAAVVLALALGACGVSPSSGPKKVGDAYAPQNLPDVAQPPAQPTAANADQLVLAYLDAAAGGGEAAVAQVAQFLTPRGYKAWQKPDKNSTGITIIRVLGHQALAKEAGTDATPVVLTYEEIGTLDDTGRVVLAQAPSTPPPRTFHVVKAADQFGQLRIDDGALPGLVLSDEALGYRYYRQQPIYFWDASNRVLVPDLRYMPLTVPPDQRAYRLISWLLHGPSQLLGTDAVNSLPINSSIVDFKSRDTTLVVKLSPQAGGKGPDDVRRLVYQFEATLFPATGRDLEIWIGNTLASSVDVADYQQYDLASQLRPPIHKYDIVDGVVKQVPSDVSGGIPAPPMLTGRGENSQVLYAAINRDLDLAAFVRGSDSGRSMVIVPATGKAVAVRGLPATTAAGRPAWLPGTDVLLVAWAGGLYEVDRAGIAKPVPTPGLGAVSAVSISPDGRRVALIAGGDVVIAVLAVIVTPSRTSVHLDGQPQTLVVDPNLRPSGVTWESEAQVYIVGRTGGETALWVVSVDGAVATNESATLKQVAPVDIVAYPSRGAFAKDGEVVLLQASGLPYRFTSPGVVPDGTTSGGVVPDGTRDPFYVD